MTAERRRSEELQLDLERYELRQGEDVLRLERIPMELLILLTKKKDQLVDRQEIIEKLWGKDVFLDTEQGINTAIRKIRQALHDDPEQPGFLQTVVGKGYRFVGPVRLVSDEVQSVMSPCAPSSGSLIANSGKNLSKGSTGWKSKAVFGAVVTLILAALALKYLGRVNRWLPRPAVRSIAVLPLKNLSGNPADDYFA